MCSCIKMHTCHRGTHPFLPLPWQFCPVKWSVKECPNILKIECLINSVALDYIWSSLLKFLALALLIWKIEIIIHSPQDCCICWSNVSRSHGTCQTLNMVVVLWSFLALVTQSFLCWDSVLQSKPGSNTFLSKSSNLNSETERDQQTRCCEKKVLLIWFREPSLVKGSERLFYPTPSF